MLTPDSVHPGETLSARWSVTYAGTTKSKVRLCGRLRYPNGNLAIACRSYALAPGQTETDALFVGVTRRTLGTFVLTGVATNAAGTSRARATASAAR